MSEAFGRRYAGILASLLAASAMALAGYLHDVYLRTVSVFYVMLLLHSFFGNGNFSIVFPYMAELWPASLRASGFGLVYGVSNIGKFIGPAGLALIAGASNYVSPKATLAAIVPAFNYFAVWYLLAVFAFLFIGIETRGLTIEELDAALVGAAQAAAAGWERIRADPRSTSQNVPNRGGRALLRNLPQIGDQIGSLSSLMPGKAMLSLGINALGSRRYLVRVSLSQMTADAFVAGE